MKKPPAAGVLTAVAPAGAVRLRRRAVQSVHVRPVCRHGSQTNPMLDICLVFARPSRGWFGRADRGLFARAQPGSPERSRDHGATRRAATFPRLTNKETRDPAAGSCVSSRYDDLASAGLRGPGDPGRAGGRL